MRREAPLIVGGGPAGSAAAITLARAGQRPIILERQRETGDALCGGFLSWRTLQTLAALGLDDLPGHRVDKLRLFAGSASAEVRLPSPAIGLSRHVLDTRLVAQAAKLGAGVERGVTARRWASGILTTSDGGELKPQTLFLASGKHDLRGLGRPDQAKQTLGLRLRLPPSAGLSALCGGAIELHLFKDGYCGVVLQENGQGNLCLAVRKSRLIEAGGDPLKLVERWAAESASFADRLGFANGAPDAIGTVPYGWIARDTVKDVFRLGDQAAVIPSLAGEGNGLALASGMMAAQNWLRGDDSGTYQRKFARAAAQPVAIAGVLWRSSERPLLAAAMVKLASAAPWLAARLAAQTRIGG